jgi:hypothetical protein
MSHIRAIRLDLNRNLTDAKLEIKENAIKLFMEHLDTLIEADRDASESLKKDFKLTTYLILNVLSFCFLRFFYC